MTTTTMSRRIYSLAKYSSGRTARSDGTLQWEHFTDPTLELHLESVSSTLDAQHQPQLQHLHLTISYLPKQPHQSQSQAQHPMRITLESFDLASFSSPTMRKLVLPPNLPLRGVWKDLAVGLRYAFVLEDGQVEFRRLQVRFKNLDDVDGFKGLIEAWCPIGNAEVAKPPAGANNGRGGRKKTVAPPSGANTSTSPESHWSTKSVPTSQHNSTLDPTTEFGHPYSSPVNVSSSSHFSPTSTSHFTPSSPDILKTPHRSSQHHRQESQFDSPLSHRVTPTRSPTVVQPSLSTLFPNLAQSPNASPHLSTITTSLATKDLLKLNDKEFTEVLLKVAEGEDFKALLERIKDVAQGSSS